MYSQKEEKKKRCFGMLSVLKEYKLECFSCPLFEKCKKASKKEREQK